MHKRQPSSQESHPSAMRVRLVPLILSAAALTLSAACTNQSPDQIREKTAEETAAIKRDTKAVAEGLKEGIGNKRAVDLNKAPKDDLAALPGMDSHKADRVIAERPFANTHQLVSRHILTEDEYAQVQDKVVVAR